MGKEWREARDARAVEQTRRMKRGIYGQEIQQYAIVEIKAKLLVSVTALASNESSKLDKILAVKSLKDVKDDINRIPEPTIENTWHPNSHRMIVVRDEFFSRCGLGTPRQRLIRTAWNFVIMIYDYDAPYRDLIDWVFEKFMEDWKEQGSMDMIAKDWSKFWSAP